MSGGYVLLFLPGLSEFFFYDYDAYSKCKSGRDGLCAVLGVMALEMDVLLGVCQFEVDICDILTVLIFTEDD